MQYAISLLALAATVSAQAGLTPLDPPGSVIAQGLPSECSYSFSGTFSFTTTNVTSSSKKARSLENVLGREKRALSCGKSIVLTLNNGLLLDSEGRTGYIADNYQYQFDGPPQAPAKDKQIIVGGWGMCPNGTLALGSSAVFWNCNSGTFNNIYDESLGGQCYQVFIDTFPCIAAVPVTTTQVSLVSPAGEMTDGQVSSTSSSSPGSASATTTGSSATTVPTAASTVPTVFPAGNSTVVSSSAAVVSTPPTTLASSTTAAAPATTVASSAGTSASSFKGAANVVAVGQGVAAVAAAAGALFML